MQRVIYITIVFVLGISHNVRGCFQNPKLSVFSSLQHPNLQHETQRRLYRQEIQSPTFLRRTIHRLFNFLDDYKNEQDDDDGTNDDASMFPPPICEPEIHRILFSTTAGDFVISVDKALSPSGVTRFLQLVDDGFFQDQLFYRILPGFLIQFGVAAHPSMQSKWDPQAQWQVDQPLQTPTCLPTCLPDEPNRATFKCGTLSFAGSGMDSRCCHMFIALEPYGKDLGMAPHETALGCVEREGLSVLEQLVQNAENAGYCNQDLNYLQESLTNQGNSAVASEYPLLDRIMGCRRI